ncbi:MAG: family 20 glycosylhydrolase [Paludisphaera borealis]|uniref:family 20 glycosylhydrolase n=1 Tax=Paludisphaera borealis TaxID=1387353 RepID=UPI00284CFEB5|nr:family 20 glycosylhydrolase [Paludisphaera borealis]MDR3621019.1 family 20 glycosylhydrolase [Paludisphaera borealis]
MRRLATTFWLLLASCPLGVQAEAPAPLDGVLPVRGFCIPAPSPKRLDEFIGFIENELAPRSVNTLILRVDYGYQYASRPELAAPGGLSKADAGKLVAACKKHKIHLIPLVNLLGHQSWASHTGRLLQAHPEFDETPWVKMPEKHSWPNPDRLYCKSYCPLHPEVHEVVFALMDEICEVFEADAFHAGLDEVFYIGEEKCPRCGKKDKSELFAGEVTRIRDRLAQKGRRMWMWGDRLIDGKTTGLGEWEASTNDTHRAVDLIPKDVVVCDWHYERADPTAAYFALKGLDVVTCPWKNPDTAVIQLQDIVNLRERTSKATRKHALGMVQTVWSGADGFLDQFYGRRPPAKSGRNGRPNQSETQCFKTLYEAIGKLKTKPDANSPAITEAKP